MLILSKAALRYAVDVCLEKKSHVIIVAKYSYDVRQISSELEDIIFDTEERPYKNSQATCIRYYYKNHSTIVIATVTENFRGRRANTVIVQKEIFDTPNVNKIFLQIETLDRYEMQ